MVVSITWATETEGIAQTLLDLGVIENGNNTTDDIFIRHDGVEDITDCAFYIRAYSGEYVGDASAADDYNELLAWGAQTGGNVGGFYINQNTHVGETNWQVHKVTQGTVALPITLSGNSVEGGGADGVIVAGTEHDIDIKLLVPANEDTAGIRMFDQCLRYTYTS